MTQPLDRRGHHLAVGVAAAQRRLVREFLVRTEREYAVEHLRPARQLDLQELAAAWRPAPRALQATHIQVGVAAAKRDNDKLPPNPVPIQVSRAALQPDL